MYYIRAWASRDIRGNQKAYRDAKDGLSLSQTMCFELPRTDILWNFSHLSDLCGAVE